MTERLFPRVSMNAAARVRTGSGEIKCCVVKLSAGGMTLETGKDDELGRFVRIATELGDHSARLDLDAIVHGRETIGDNRRWRVEFHDPQAHVVSRVADFVRERIAAHSPAQTPKEGLSDDGSTKSRRELPTDPELERLFEKALSHLG